MKIVIVGGGAIGRLFGYFLVKGENEVTMIDTNQKTLTALQNRGIGLVNDEDEYPEEAKSFPVRALSSAESLSEADLVILTVKSQATLAAVKNIAHLINDSCPLLCMQTGLGNLEVASKIVPKEDILLGITFMSGTALSEARVRQGRQAMTKIGEVNGIITKRLENINRVFTQCEIENEMAPKIVSSLWCKVITYSAMNPVSALLQVPNGSLTSRMESITLMKRLLDEGKAVANSCSVELVCGDLYELLFDTCEKSSNNLSSMLQDILNGVPTEIDAQNGAICRFAKEHGVNVPTHKTMVELIKLLEYWKPGME